jgi:hypothetical protein
MPKKGKTVKGGYYGFGKALSTGAVDWHTGQEAGDFTKGRAGNGMYGGKKNRRRTLKKSRRRKMRGGEKFSSVVAGFNGTGQRGMGNYSAVNVKGPGAAAYGAFNNKGAAPGNFSSFKGLLPK